jgi:hypothetical protein
MFVAKRHLWEEARRLRSEGWSLRRIARELDVSLSSASVWTRGCGPDAPVPAPQEVLSRLNSEPLRWCSRCSRELPESSFNRFGSGLQWWCRDCFKAYYAERRAHHRRRNNALKTQRIREAQNLVLSHLRVHPCLDCDEADPVVLEFDHMGAKRADISTLVRRGVLEPVLAAEVARCDVVCANCHRRRTARRQGWRVVDRRWKDGWRSKQLERNVLFATDVLRASGCVDCGELDLCVLEFDHVGAKTGGVMRLARREVGLDRLSAEIQRCDVRCVNCHRRRTAREAGAFRARAEYPQRESNSRYEVENLAC